MKDPSPPRGGLSVAALAVVLFVPLTVGWTVERLAYGEACATEEVVAPLYESEPVRCIANCLAASECAPSTAKDAPVTDATTVAATKD